jgi:hypothetical protein
MICHAGSLIQAPEEESADGDDDNWGDDFGTFEEAADVAEAQPASESAEQTASAILPQAPCKDTQASDNSRLFTATHEQLLQLVCNLLS